MEWLDQKVLRQLADDIGHDMMPVVISVFVEEVGGNLPSSGRSLISGTGPPWPASPTA